MHTLLYKIRTVSSVSHRAVCVSDKSELQLSLLREISKLKQIRDTATKDFEVWRNNVCQSVLRRVSTHTHTTHTERV
jgi:hypothetical protein